MKKFEKKIIILLKVKLETLVERCVRNLFKEVYEYLIGNEDYERASKIRAKEKQYNAYLKKHKNVKKGYLRTVKL